MALDSLLDSFLHRKVNNSNMLYKHIAKDTTQIRNDYPKNLLGMEKGIPDK